MYNLSDYETRMVHDGKRNNREVLIVCERCGKKHWMRWQRVRKGQGRFCSLECFNKYQQETLKVSMLVRKMPNAYFNKRLGRWCVYWYSKDGKRHTTSYARWWWQINKGPIPKGYRASYKDGNSRTFLLKILFLSHQKNMVNK